MQFDVMTGTARWSDAAALARHVEQLGVSGLVFTETGQTPWMGIAAAASATTNLQLASGVVVAFSTSPMVAATNAWEVAQNSSGRFRLGLGSQVKAHVERRYGMEFDPVVSRMRDYVSAVKAILAAFRGESKLAYEGQFYSLSLLPDQWRPPKHEFGDVRVDISAVGPQMLSVAGQVADGVHVHPLHSMEYITQRMHPALAKGAELAGRSASTIDLLIPVFIVAGDSREEQEHLRVRSKTQIGFYGSTKNYAFQFDDLGFEGTSARLNERIKTGDMAGVADTITDEMLERFAVVGAWDEIADRLIDRYSGVASNVISYLTVEDIARRPENAGRWAEIARAVQSAAQKQRAR